MSEKTLECCVIGGAGFIGRHLTRLLVASGRRVRVLGRSATPSRPLPPSVQYQAGDYGDRELLKQWLAGADEVIDLAYGTVPQTSYIDPLFDIRSNLPPTVTLLQEAGAVGIRRLVIVSSGGTIYGQASALPIREDHPTEPISPYGITKLTQEKYAMMAGRCNGLPVVIARPGNAYGDEQRAFSGQGFIATAIQSVIKGAPLVMYGEPGTIRDYVHVTDVATGIMAVLERGDACNAYNIGTGIGSSNRDVLDLIEPLAKAAGHAMEVQVQSPRRFDVAVNVLDSTRLHLASGWRPKIALAEGIQKAWLAALAQA